MYRTEWLELAKKCEELADQILEMPDCGPRNLTEWAETSQDAQLFARSVAVILFNVARVIRG